MKALTLMQPWAYAVEHLGKPVENRSWAPPAATLGKRFAIHAGKQLDRDALLDFIDDGMIPKGASAKQPAAVPIPRGAVTCSAVLRGWVRGTDDLFSSSRRVLQVVGDVTPERALAIVQGRWWAGPIGWVLDGVLGLSEPVPCSGALGVWEVPADLVELVRERTLLARPKP